METGKTIRITEMARIASISKSAVTQSLKNEIGVSTGRIYGVEPEAAQRFFIKRGFGDFYKSGLFVISTQTGGSGKTSTTINLAISARRITDRKHAIIMIDGDSQASLSKQTTGDAAPIGEATLNSFIENNSSIDDLLTDVGDNMFVVRSNLQNLYNDRSLSNVTAVRNTMSNLVRGLFKKFGDNTKIFVDTPPQLSAVSQSFILACSDIEFGYLLIPIRPDSFGISGAKICIRESLETLRAFKMEGAAKICCFLSAHNSRSSASMTTLKDIIKSDDLSKYISPVMIRYSQELPKSTFRQGGIFNETKNIKTIGSDYMDLLLTTMGWEAPE